MNFEAQSIADLEFDTLCGQLSNYCKSKKAKKNAANIKKLADVEAAKREFAILDEIQRIHEAEDLSMPHPATDSIDGALKLLHINNGVLTLDELLRVYTLCIGTQRLIKFAQQNRANFPLVYEACEHISEVDSILKLIQSILNERNEIKDDATPTLAQIRKQYASNHREINKNFEKSLKRCRKDDVLDDIGETFLDEKRLLAVQSGQVKQVDGKQVGASSKGHIIYVEPATNVRLNQHQAQLRNEEKAEIFKILADLTDQLRSRKKDLEAFQRLLVRFDLYNAKVLFAKSYAGIIPKITDNKEFEWFNARHPLLYLEHQSTQEKTIGQDLYLSPKQRFLVISGPNAGGKSITLKTVGLVQMMFQSGLLVPLDLNSSCCWFDEVLSDIGDNQSIQDQLSTYSYRLKRMRYFLDSVDENTLLLLDEFGSGSDPELGGALAEVFFEQLYQKKCFAVITTHYANIKIITSELEEAINACMLFDTEKLNPLYRLSVGQPGSSFTFEVAALNGIDPQLVEAAKGKVSQSKLNIDELTAALQKEKSELKKLTAELQRKSIAANKTQNEYSEKLEKLQQKAEQQSAYLEQQAKYFSVGKRVFDYIKKYEKQETNKALNEAVKRLVGKEKSKITALKKTQADAKKKKEIKAALLMEQEIKAPDLPKSKQKKGKEKQEVVAEPAQQKVFKVGDFAQLKSTGQRGTITDISGNKATLEVGNFLITTKLSELS